MKGIRTRKDFLNLQQPRPTIVLTWDQVELICERAVEKYVNRHDDYRAKFASLPDQMNAKTVGDFLKLSAVTIQKYKNQGKLNFVKPDGKHPFITKEQLIEDCRKHGLV